jgi:tetratricopeptide (TPR) repeat protein
MLIFKNMGIKTGIILGGLAVMMGGLIFLWQAKLLPSYYAIPFSAGCVIFIVLNIFDRKDQLKKLGDTLLTRGEELYKKGETKGAIRDYTKALELKGPNLRAFLGISQCYKGMNEYKKCMEYAKKALELKSDSSHALFLLGISLFRQDYPDGAIKHLENAVSITPDLSEAHFMIGEIHTSLGRKEEAVKAYTRFLEQCKDEKAAKAIKEKITKLSA